MVPKKWRSQKQQFVSCHSITNTKDRTYGATDLLRMVNCHGALPQRSTEGNGDEADGFDIEDVVAETEGLTLDEPPKGVLFQEEIDLLLRLYKQQKQPDGPNGLINKHCDWVRLFYQFNLAVIKKRRQDPSCAECLKLKTPALLKQAHAILAEQKHSKTLIEKAGLLDHYIRVLKWLKDSSKFNFTVPAVRLPGPDSRPAAAQVVAAATASPELTYNGPLFKLNYKVSKNMSLQVLRRRPRVLDNFRIKHCHQRRRQHWSRCAVERCGERKPG